MKTLRDIPIFENIPILVRAAMNVPVEDGAVVNDYRLRRAVPTIRYLCERHARVILLSHIGEQGTETLAPVAEALGKLISDVSFCDVTTGEKARAAVRKLRPGHVLVLENVRRAKGETENDSAFAKELAALADVFVQDSFDTCHRVHASMVGVPRLLPSYAGILLEEEVAELSKAMHPESPSLAVIGGAKFATKEPALQALLAGYDRVFVGGALANDFLKASGNEVGVSLVSSVNVQDMHPLLENQKLMLPKDVTVVPKDALGAADIRMRSHSVSLKGVKVDDAILDVGSGTAAMLADLATRAKTVLWNGPLGNYEHGFVDATNALARAVAHGSAHSVVGGGDTVAAIENLGILHDFSFVSTGGGAMLDFLAKGTLPGIEALDIYK